MARNLNGSTSNYFYYGSALLTLPFTVAVWFRLTSASLQTLVSSADEGGTDRFAFTVDASNFPTLSAVDSGGTTSVSAGAAASLSTWAHAVAVGASSTDRRIYIDGGNKATSSTSRSPTSLDNTTIGIRVHSGPTAAFDGRIAHVGIWNVALDDDEIAALAKSFAPPAIRLGSLVEYWQMNDPSAGNEIGLKGLTQTLTGSSTKQDSPRIILPSRPR